MKERIYEAALDVFYEKGYKDSTMREIAERAAVPVGLIYTYYKGKAELLDAIVEPMLGFFTTMLSIECHENAAIDNYFIETQKMLMTLLHSRKAMIVAMDKSVGTKYENLKEQVVKMLTEHIARERPLITTNFEPFHADIVATCFVEAVMVITRRYESHEWAERMLAFVADKLFPPEIPRPA